MLIYQRSFKIKENCCLPFNKPTIWCKSCKICLTWCIIVHVLFLFYSSCVEESKLTPNYCNSTLWKPSNQTETRKPLPGYSKCLFPGQSNQTNYPYVHQWIQNTGFNDSATYNCLVRTDENPFATTNLEKKWMGNQTCDKGDAKHRRCLGQQSNKCIDAECKFFSWFT